MEVSQLINPSPLLAARHEPAVVLLAKLVRDGERSVLIVAGDKPVGFASRRDLARAVQYGLGHQAVGKLFPMAPPTIDPRSVVRDAWAVIKNPGVQGVALIRKGAPPLSFARLEFVLALEALKPAHLKGCGLFTECLVSPAADQIMSASLPPFEREMITHIATAAGDRRVYLVGGAVRDLLLRRPVRDLDFLVEGDSLALASSLAQMLGGQVSHHEEFGTAKVVFPSGRPIDVAQARTESYDKPGALPLVKPGNLLEDMARRDFSVNAMALRLDSQGFGLIVDAFGGRQDLASGTLRALHPLSFVEDPARLVRAVRFERVLGMRLDADSAAQARSATANGILDGIGGERFKVEIRRLLGLPDLKLGVGRLAELGAWSVVAPQIDQVHPPRAELERLEELVTRDEGPDGHGRDKALFRGTLALLLRGLHNQTIARSLTALNLTSVDAKAILGAIAAEGTHYPYLRGLMVQPPSKRFRQLAGLGPEALRHMLAISNDAAARAQIHGLIAEHLVLRKIRLEGVNGHWLKTMGFEPGPDFGRIVTGTLDAVLDGKITGPEQERVFALELARQLKAARKKG